MSCTSRSYCTSHAPYKLTLKLHCFTQFSFVYFAIFTIPSHHVQAILCLPSSHNIISLLSLPPFTSSFHFLQLPHTHTGFLSFLIMKAQIMRKEFRLQLLVLVAAITSSISLFYTITQPSFDVNTFRAKLRAFDNKSHPNSVSTSNSAQSTSISNLAVIPASSIWHKRLIIYNRPPKTGSTTVRIAVKHALDDYSMHAAKCFNMIEWNEMALKTIVNRRNIDFYGCHTRLTNERYAYISQMRGGNVTFITNTREPSNIILSAYLQLNRERNIAQITDPSQMAKEVQSYKNHVEKYPVDALYAYHGSDVPLSQCPIEWRHEEAMRRVAERYELIIDLSRPKESSAMMKVVTGLSPDFTSHFNERTKDTSGSMLAALKAVNTSHKLCGNELVHKVLMQQFNIIKDRLMQNRCFDEDTGTFELCEKVVLDTKSLSEKTRTQSYAARDKLLST